MATGGRAIIIAVGRIRMGWAEVIGREEEEDGEEEEQFVARGKKNREEERRREWERRSF